MNRLGHARGFDFHCHIDLDRNPPAVIARCEKDRIITLAVTTTPKAWSQNREWTRQSEYVLPALGLHPELVAERHGEISLLEAIMPEARFIGEVGLDGGAPHRESMPLQQEVFRQVLGSAQRLGGRVLTIHSRAAAKEVIDMIAKHTTNDRVLCILHWFSGNPSGAIRAATLGCYFSVNSKMLEHERGRSLIEQLPIDRLLTETDSPFTQESGRNSLPWDAILTAGKLAKFRSIAPEQMHRLLADNARRVINFANVPAGV